MMEYLLLLCIALLTFSSAKAEICDRTPLDTTASKRPGDNGFRILITGHPSPEKYIPNEVYTVSINGTNSQQNVQGFMLTAVPLNARDERRPLGTLQTSDNSLTRDSSCPHVMADNGPRRRSVSVQWVAPPTGSGCVEFRATVIEYTDIWYKDDGELTRVFCEQTENIETQPVQQANRECCACGSAKYTVTFVGTWSRQSHPKDYPTHKRLLHWSNIVGASHDKDYSVWAYDDYATRGVKEVCEFGYTSTLEDEMRQHSSDVRTVIKTTGIWWKDPVGLRQDRMARFSVDRRRHLLSLLSMLGPSPDWCVGVSDLNLCLPNCTWAGDQDIDLFPWDAGTDNGLTYMAPNAPSDPQQRIKKITSNFPDSPISPFYESDPLRPLARLEIRRISPKLGQPLVCTGEDEEEEFELDFGGDSGLSDMDMKKKMMMMSGKCAVSDWRDWSGCSVTCGVGMRVRNRDFLMPDIDENMCPGIDLMQKENCIGVENTCEDPEEACSVTDWSEWSPCSVSCGAGMRERRRIYMRTESTAPGSGCGRRLRDPEECAMHDCSITRQNATAICNEPRDVGPCRGSFTRWFYDSNMRKCIPFTYGGCRGNNNRFMTEPECISMCAVTDLVGQAVTPASTRRGGKDRQKNNKNNDKSSNTGDDENRTQRVDCMATKWSEWSSCTASCGKAFQTSQRLVKRQAQNGGKQCPKKLNKKRRCRLPKCPRSASKRRTRNRNSNNNGEGRRSENPCQFTQWSAWSECSATCGEEAYRVKRRRVESNGPAEQCSSARLERRQACDNLPGCSARVARPCELGPWSAWSPCPPVTCIQERMRPVLAREERGGTPCGTRIQRRMCVTGPCAQYSQGRNRG